MSQFLSFLLHFTSFYETNAGNISFFQSFSELEAVNVVNLILLLCQTL